MSLLLSVPRPLHRGPLSGVEPEADARPTCLPGHFPLGVSFFMHIPAQNSRIRETSLNTRLRRRTVSPAHGLAGLLHSVYSPPHPLSSLLCHLSLQGFP